MLDSIRPMAPNYLVEQCKAVGSYPMVDEPRNDGATCELLLTFDPHHATTPGLIAFYEHRNLHVHVCRLEDIFAIVIENHTVLFEIRNNPSGFTVTISDRAQRESFLSFICGYYR